MKFFQINENLQIKCEWKKTRTAFKHVATLLENGWKHLDETKICYQNRTWESYEFESVIHQLLDGKMIKSLLTEEEIEKVKESFAKQAKGEIDKQFKTIANIAKLGEVFSKTKKESNDWKARMLKAGLSSKGLIMPEDWDTLDEETKEIRLNAVISQLS